MTNPLPYLDALDITVWQRRDKPLRVASQMVQVANAADDTTLTSAKLSTSSRPTEQTVESISNSVMSQEPTTLRQTQRTASVENNTTPAAEPNTPAIDAPPDYLFVPPDAVFTDNFEPLLSEDNEPLFEPEPALDPKQVRAQEISTLDWQALQARVQQCKDCELHKKRNNTVFGVGNTQARWLIVGEAPGHDEDLQGEPFVGRAGQLLNAMLQAVGVQREQVFIANTVKCRPPNNRNPDALERETCAPYLQRQIQLIQPQLILVIGRVAVQQVLHSEDNIGRLRGKRHTYADTDIPVIVSYHPAYLLRRPAEKAKAWEDLQRAYRWVQPF